MAEFHCRVANVSGEIFERSFSANDEDSLRRELESQDLMLLDARRHNTLVRSLAKTFRIQGTVSSREFLIFNQELDTKFPEPGGGHEIKRGRTEPLAKIQWTFRF